MLPVVSSPRLRLRMLPVEPLSCLTNGVAVPWGEKGLGLSVLDNRPILEAGHAEMTWRRQN